MRRALIAFVALAGAASACAVGPTYHRPDVAAPDAWRAPSAAEDSLRPFFDSLARGADLIPPSAGAPQPAAIRTSEAARFRSRAIDSSAVLGWADLFQDSVLRALVSTAVRENRDVRVAAATIELFRAQYGVVRGSLFPQISANAFGGPLRTLGANGKTVALTEVQLTTALAWELDFWGRLRRETQAARSDFLASEQSQRAIVLSLVSDVATSYLQLRELDLDLEISRRTMASRQETLRLALRRYQQGLISELDVRQFEAEVASSAVRVADFERQIAQQENAISVLIGRSPGSIPRGRSLPEVLGTFTVPTTLPSALIARRPDIRQAENELAAATARIGSAQGARLPALALSSQAGTVADKPGNTFRGAGEIYQLFAGVSIPLFRGGELANRVRAAEAREAQARFGYERATLVARREAEDAFVGVRMSRDQATAQARQVDALKRARDLANRRYENGISSYLEVLDAERNLFSSEIALTQAQRQELVAGIQLYKALGGGW
ncbi:MAG: efflux transporter outer membrane subunit [Gemmatimonadaceae bacterium]